MRVSDALRRATEQNTRSILQTVDEPEDLAEEVRAGYSHADGKGHSPKGQEQLISQTAEEQEGRQDQLIVDVSHQPAKTNGQLLSYGLFPGTESKPKRGLRHRVENLLLGRDRNTLKSHPLLALERNSPAGEQYRILREQIKKITSAGGAGILAVTSPVKGDGKSTVAANLAAAIALDYEQQILLIDGDLRGPSIHQFFGVKSTPGLAEYLSSNSRTDLMSYVQATSLSGLRILPGGKPSTHSSELLAQERMKALIREVPARFPGHLIIVDTSPILSTPDPFVLAQQVDGILMVIRAGKTPRACLSEAIKSLGSNKMMGVILNGAELGTASRYYYSAPSQARLANSIK